MSDLTASLERTFDLLESMRQAHEAQLRHEQIGRVQGMEQGVARVEGLPHVGSGELVRFPRGVLGLALDLRPQEVGVILLGKEEEIGAGDEARPTGRVLDVPVGRALVGRVVNAIGQPLDRGGAIQASERWPVERPAPAILDRAAVSEPLQTGVKVVDALVPIGRGQRELIVGDRQTGKTTLAVDTILNQKDVLCVYCAIGQQDASVAKLIATLREHGAMAYTTVVVAAGDDTPGLQYIAPYAATAIGEYFMAQGRDVLVVYDDLTQHARAYRALSLLLRRPPGREAYPGDIFFVHARLLERATHLREGLGSGSLTALPIVETEAQNISAYIPTNLISITDGQIFLSTDLFQKGQLPAVNVGRSVSRVGGKAQLPAYQAVVRDLRLAYSQFEELESFARFGAQLDEDTRRRLTLGRRVRAVLQQTQYQPLPVAEQIAVLLAAAEGLFNSLPVEAVDEAAATIRRRLPQELPALVEAIEGGEPLDDEGREEIVALVRAVVREWEEGGDHDMGQHGRER
ncbi:MAG TPA: alternate F1F0 ATPase, F1 subunit alpha [Candidatus Sulfomarinibacteraceae bacterium]|nr:alternate F1F0 ATPase, F1 subunit alpha [Candidatus Sulfomarinibacteraceae bacterium]